MQLSFITNLLTVKLKNMRKTKFSIICLSALLAGSMTFTSCGDDDDKSTNGGNGEIDKPIEPVKPDDKTVMTSQEQKQYLETVAKEFMNTIPSKDFKNLSDFGKYISDVYAQQYEWDAVETWGEDIMDELLQTTGTKDTETEEYWGSTYTYIYTNYKALIQASNFTGHFTARNGKWNLTQANDLQFIFTDENGKECVLKLKTSGNVKKVHMFNIDDWTDDDYHYDEEADRYYSTYYYDRTAYTLGVPENIEVTLSRGGSNMVKTAVKIDLNGISNEEFDLSKGNLSLSCTTEFDNGYKLDVSKVTYTANKNVSVTTQLSKSGKSLVNVAVASDLSGIPSCNISAFTESDGDYDEDEEDEYKDVNAKNAFVKIDIIGKLQMQGKITDVKKFSNYLDNADENDENEARFKSYINQANGMMDMGIFYDGKSVKQADVQFEPFMEGNSYYSYWYCEPVMKFQDGSSYSTFEAFFNETDFKSVIDLFIDLTDQYADLLDSDNW